MTIKKASMTIQRFSPNNTFHRKSISGYSNTTGGLSQIYIKNKIGKPHIIATHMFQTRLGYRLRES